MTHASRGTRATKRGLAERGPEPYGGLLRDHDRVYGLRDVRRACDLTQQQLAGHMGVNQKRVCEIELADIDRTQVSTLKRYVEGLGGTLHVSIALPGNEPIAIV
ncbi:XRE family transcriptional regulator [Bifidobacterium platyrrhinorum]|uniref:Helix-turn-helix domain-containing protein n=1 Tax=Bifidobacterium platyrrhinorum TaxID=2661628 RepID=A0A6L9SR13_9BIFI|nr:XRE family transcriptional regulator [Bifidobacterium platyrrhinorum]NEG54980.1 helix-turn-helix domain-containing protein [Bifidobacterium platyrrhinorum]